MVLQCLGITGLHWRWNSYLDESADGICVQGGLLFVIKDRDRAYHNYYRYHALHKYINGSSLFHLQLRVHYAFKYVGLYTFAHRMGTDAALLAIVLLRCNEVRLDKTLVKNGSNFFNLSTGAVYGLAKKSFQAGKTCQTRWWCSYYGHAAGCTSALPYPCLAW